MQRVKRIAKFMRDCREEFFARLQFGFQFFLITHRCADVDEPDRARIHTYVFAFLSLLLPISNLTRNDSRLKKPIV